MTSRGPADSWTPGGLPSGPVPPPPPPSGANSHPYAVPRPDEASGSDVHYAQPRHAAPHDGFADVYAPPAPESEEPPATRRGPLAALTRALTARSRMANLDQRLIEFLQDTPEVYGKVAFVCAKGGVSKTVHTAIVSLILARWTQIPIAAVDFNPDQGTLGARLAHHEDWGRTIRELIDTTTYGNGSVNLSDFITPTSTGASAIISGNMGIDAKDISAQQYESAMSILHSQHPIVLIDTGNSMTTEVYESILRTVDQIVLVGSFRADGATTAANTLGRIRQAGGRLETIANQSLVSIARSHGISARVDVGSIREHFAAHSRGSVREIPWDEHINEGGVIDLDLLSPKTRREFTILAADIAAALSHRPLFSTTILPEYL